MEHPGDILNRPEVRLKGHFVTRSGRHTAEFLEKNAIFTDSMTVGILGIDMGLPFRFTDIECVVGKGWGGGMLAQATAKFYNLDNQASGKPLVRNLGVEKDGSENLQLLSSHTRYANGRKILIAAAVVTTGNTLRRTIGVVRQAGGNVAGVTVLCTRSPITKEDLGVPALEVLVRLELETWTAGHCPLCRSAVPINTEIGYGAHYVQKHGQPKKQPNRKSCTTRRRQ